MKFLILKELLEATIEFQRDIFRQYKEWVDGKDIFNLRLTHIRSSRSQCLLKFKDSTKSIYDFKRECKKKERMTFLCECAFRSQTPSIKEIIESNQYKIESECLNDDENRDYVVMNVFSLYDLKDSAKKEFIEHLTHCSWSKTADYPLILYRWQMDHCRLFLEGCPLNFKSNAANVDELDADNNTKPISERKRSFNQMMESKSDDLNPENAPFSKKRKMTANIPKSPFVFGLQKQQNTNNAVLTVTEIATKYGWEEIAAQNMKSFTKNDQNRRQRLNVWIKGDDTLSMRVQPLNRGQKNISRKTFEKLLAEMNASHFCQGMEEKMAPTINRIDPAFFNDRPRKSNGLSCAQSVVLQRSVARCRSALSAAKQSYHRYKGDIMALMDKYNASRNDRDWKRPNANQMEAIIKSVVSPLSLIHGIFGIFSLKLKPITNVQDHREQERRRRAVSW